jgi:hypothetical protein
MSHYLYIYIYSSRIVALYIAINLIAHIKKIGIHPCQEIRLVYLSSSPSNDNHFLDQDLKMMHLTNASNDGIYTMC